MIYERSSRTMCIRYLWSKFGILLAVCFVIGSTSISAQTLYRFGQSVQPIFEVSRGIPMELLRCGSAT